MKNKAITVLAAGFLVLIVSLAILYSIIYFFPILMDEYYNPVFRSNSFKTDWLFYLHPFVLSWALSWFWDRCQGLLSGSVLLRAGKFALAYAAIAMVPVLWLTFSALDISVLMVLTWLAYAIVQSFFAALVFAKFNP